MRFPNAAKGIKKVFTSNILTLIAAIAIIVGIVLSLVTLVAAATENEGGTIGAALGTVVLLVVAGVLMIVAFIIQIIGISQASKDESYFKTAMICLFVGIVGSLVGSIFSANTVVSGICNTVTQIMNLAVTLFVISGIVKLANQLNNSAVIKKGGNLIKVITAVYVLALIGNLIVLILGGYVASITACVIALVAVLLEIVAYFMYLSLLGKAKKMLEQE